jgi:hypothetical protein
MVGRMASKSLLSTTLICRSNAAGEALPPHIQFATKAQSKETMRLEMDSIQHIPDVRGQWGLNREEVKNVTFGMNKKGGMDEKEFKDYIMLAIVPLYANARNRKGRYVILKVVSGPGWSNIDLLVRLKMLRFILYPGVPNTTHVTQEMDRKYSPFKIKFVSNLNTIMSERIAERKSLSLQPKLVGLLVFGGEDPETGCMIPMGAFQDGFLQERCLDAWAKIGAATSTGKITRACLSDKQVMQGGGC